MKEPGNVLCLIAHPDDAEFQCGGTLAMLSGRGWHVTIASMTPGQAGSAQLNATAISEVRRAESADAAQLIKGDYVCMESEDLFIAYDKPTLEKAIALFRRVRPDIVFTASPSDYIIDHEVTSRIAQTACLGANIPNIEIPGSVPTGKVPYLYYCDPIQGKDRFGHEVRSEIFVDISVTIDLKEQMLACHKSQRRWLSRISNEDDYLMAMRDFSSRKGKEIQCAYAEGFRQHLGYSYPLDNILKRELNDFVYPK